MRKLLSIAVALLLLGAVAGQAQAFLFDTTFQLAFEDDYVDQTPLYNRTVYVYNGDYEFKSPTFDPYPYDFKEAHKRHWLIAAVETDGRGKFTLNMNDIKAKKFYLRIGPKYRLIEIEKSSDLNHTPSDHHLRIEGFEKGTTTVNRNDIYDVKKGIHTVVGTDGKSIQEPFKRITLRVQKVE
jgi:hypothetical protein